MGFTAASVDAIAEAARVTKGAVYHHFRDKSALFEAVFVALDESMVAAMLAASPREEVWAQIDAGLDTYLAACCAPRFRRIVLEEAPRALGWSRWRELEMRYFGAIVRTSIERLAAAGEIVTPSTELTAQVFLGATSEAALAVAASEGRAEDRSQAKELLLRLLGGLRPAV